MNKNKNPLFALIIVILLGFSSLSLAQNDENAQKDGNKKTFDFLTKEYSESQLKIKKTWNNLPSNRGASIYMFRFTVPEDYVASTKFKRNSNFLSKIEFTKGLSYYAKYTVMKLTDSILSKASGKKIITFDPEQSRKIAATSSSGFSEGFAGFESLPIMTRNAALRYDDSVSYIMSLNVSFSGNLFGKPVCKILIKVYNREKDRVAKYKYEQKFRKLHKENEVKVYRNPLTGRVWSSKTTSGIPIPKLLSMYVITLNSMMNEIGGLQF